jgi:hypothetical protein
MSFDQRIRDGLRDAADSARPDVERSLHRVMSGSHRPRSRHRAFAVAAVALAAIVLIAAVPLARGRWSDNPTVLEGRGTLPGQYQVTLSASDVAALDPAMAGVWRMRLRPDGTVELSAPASYAGRGPAGASCAAPTAPCRYEASGDTVRTNLLPGVPGPACNAIGTYSYRLAGGRLTLSTVDDQCVARRTLLASHPWKDLADPRLPEGTYRTSALSLAQLRSAGTTAGFDAAAVEAFWRQQGVTNEATLTLNLEAGVWTLFVAADGKSGVAVWTGDYTVTGNGTVQLTEANVSCARATYHFRIEHDQLRFDALAPECATERLRLAALHESAPFVLQR